MEVPSPIASLVRRVAAPPNRIPRLANPAALASRRRLTGRRVSRPIHQHAADRRVDRAAEASPPPSPVLQCRRSAGEPPTGGLIDQQQRHAVRPTPGSTSAHAPTASATLTHPRLSNPLKLSVRECPQRAQVTSRLSPLGHPAASCCSGQLEIQISSQERPESVRSEGFSFVRPRDQFERPKICRKNRKTFRTSRKMPAASGIAWSEPA